MCKRCDYTGKIIYGTDTENGRESVQCDCKCCNINWKDLSKDEVDAYMYENKRELEIELNKFNNRDWDK
jgi:hypothetical protein